jgi:hypothetical protein
MVGLAVLVLAVLVAASSGPGPSADSASGPTGSADAAVHLSTGDGSRSGVSGSGAPSTSAAGQVVDAVHRIGRPPPSTVSVVPLSETAEPPVTVAPGGHAAAGGEPTTLAVGSGPSTTSTAPTSGKTSTVTTAKSPSTTSTSKPTATTSTSKPPSTTSTSKPTATTPTSKPTATTPTSKPPSTTSTPPTPTANSNPSTGPWQLSPSPSLEWQWELGHPLSMTSNADLGLGDTTYTGAASGNPTVYDIDGFDNGAATVAALHAIGAHVICYIDVGTWEDWRPDAGEFPTALLGSSNGWPGEQWLNTNPSGPDYATLQAIMTARFQMCKNEGYDAVEPDNLDGSENSTGFPLTVAEGDRYAEWVADEVHALGMSVAQKNFEDQSSILEPYFDFVIEEQCFQFGDCADLAPYTAAGKAVLNTPTRAPTRPPTARRPSQTASARSSSTRRWTAPSGSPVRERHPRGRPARVQPDLRSDQPDQCTEQTRYRPLRSSSQG